VPSILRLTVFAIEFVGLVSIAVALWLDIRLEERRRRLVRGIETILANEDYRNPQPEVFKRVA
jgi:hypothetical protein